MSGRRVGSDDGRFWAHAGYGRVLDELGRRFGDLLVAGPSAPRSEALNTAVDLAPHQVLELPDLTSIVHGTTRTREVVEVLRQVDQAVDVVLVQLAFQAPLALLALRKPRLYHVVGDPLGVALDSEAYAGPRRIPAVLSAAALDGFHKLLVRQPGAGLVTNGEELRRALAPGKGRSVVSSTLWDREIESATRTRPADAPPRVLFVGYLRAWKGVDVLLRAYDLLLDREPATELVIVGPGELDAVVPGDLLDRVRTRGSIRTLGSIGFGPELFQVYADADVLALPSRRGEGTPRVLVEARAFRCPVVATAVGGVPSSVDHGVDGLLVDPGDAPMLAQGLYHLLNDRRDRARMVEAGVARAHRSTVETFVDAIAAEATDVLERDRTQP